MVTYREAYEAGGEDFIGCTAVSAVFEGTIGGFADRSVFVPICEVFGEMKLFPARSTRDGIRISAVDTLATLKRILFDRRRSDECDGDEYDEERQVCRRIHCI